MNGRGRSRPSTQAQLERLPGWLIVIQLALAYQWSVSGINKLLDPHFGTQLVPLLRGSTQGSPYGWYAGFLRAVVLTNHAPFALAVQIMEPAVGFALLLSAMLWIVRPRRFMAAYVGLLGSAALVGSIGLSLNYFFQEGTYLPWIDSANALNPGVDINIMTALVSAVLLGAHLTALRASRRKLELPSLVEREAAESAATTGSATESSPPAAQGNRHQSVPLRLPCQLSARALRHQRQCSQEERLHSSMTVASRAVVGSSGWEMCLMMVTKTCPRQRGQRNRPA